MSKPLVSVIMPVYNAEKYLRETIQSILTQTLPDFELIIINDASSDASRQIIGSFTDQRIQYYENETNKGYIFSLNNALQLAKGKFIARMDADDLSLPNRLLAQFNFLERESSIDLVGAAVTIDRETSGKRVEGEVWNYPVTPGGVKARLLFNTSHAHPVVFFRRSLIDRKLYTYEPSYYPAEDYELWTRLNKYVNTSNLSEPQLIYRISENQTSSVALDRQKHNAARIRSAYYHSLLRREETDQGVYNFWHNNLHVETAVALRILNGMTSIYDSGKDSDFRKELSAQVNSLVHRAYQIHPELITAYERSVFQKIAPLSLKDKLKFKAGILRRRILSR